MPIVTVMDAIGAWTDEHICREIMLKSPDSTQVDDTYKYKLVHPAVFLQFQPTEDKLPEGVDSAIPSITIRAVDGTDMLVGGKREIHTSMLLSTWDPGLHKNDTFNPVGNTGAYRYSDKNFKKNSEGWRDAWNFADFVLRKIENEEFLNGYRIEKERGINFSEVSAQNSTSDFYPFWFSSIEFWVEEPIGLSRIHNYYDELL